MTHPADIATLSSEDALWSQADAALRAIPPVWPLASSVAVNPYLGQSGETLAIAGERLARVSGTAVTMPRHWYADQIERGQIRYDDVADAWAACTDTNRPTSAADVIAAAQTPRPAPAALPTVAQLTVSSTETDWPALITERLGAWAASYFDTGQALWIAPHGRGAYAAWRLTATHDLTPEIAGLKGFAQFVADAPETADAAIARAVRTLGLSDAALPTYFHALLMDLGGWAQVARYELWQAELAGGTDRTGVEMLAIRLVWEEALYHLADDAISQDWQASVASHAAPLVPSKDMMVDVILQEAAERAEQRRLADQLGAQTSAQDGGRDALQMAFCIDVRSEVFRRALEAVDPSIRTLGFAGFFGLATGHKRFASDVVEHRLPVLLNAGVHSQSGSSADAAADRATRLSERAVRAWGRFRQAAVSSFAFVEATGPVYAAKLVKDSLALHTPALPNDPAPQLSPPLPLDARVDAANTILRAMSLTEGFARLVVVAGHGATVTNNAHASALQCGACGGYSGEVNARLLAGLLNDTEVRAELVDKGISIPSDTHFVGALHDTTTDNVKLYDQDSPSSAHASDVRQARAWLEAAGAVARSERALRLPRAEGAGDLARRSRDWAETRPEWALANCKAFIAAPRSRTQSGSLSGRAFLHDYDWQQDEGFGVLELIMTAPVVVASWISLQYYGSSVSPEVFGGGNKLIHNVSGGLGVVEGNGGVLRPGLPWQSVHDGTSLMHDPLRLSVCIEAPREAMTRILAQHDGVRDLFDNRWLHLFALDQDGRMAWRYSGGLKWEPVATSNAAETHMVAAE